jgi:hypothetical protein
MCVVPLFWLLAMLRVIRFSHYTECHNAKCIVPLFWMLAMLRVIMFSHYAECHNAKCIVPLFWLLAMLCVIMFKVITLNVIMPGGAMLRVAVPLIYFFLKTHFSKKKVIFLVFPLRSVLSQTQTLSLTSSWPSTSSWARCHKVLIS